MKFRSEGKGLEPIASDSFKLSTPNGVLCSGSKFAIYLCF